MKRRWVVLLSLAAVVILVAAAVFLLFLRSFMAWKLPRRSATRGIRPCCPILPTPKWSSLKAAAWWASIRWKRWVSTSRRRPAWSVNSAHWKKCRRGICSLGHQGADGLEGRDPRHAAACGAGYPGDSPWTPWSRISRKIERHPSEDAYAYLENGAFHIQPEVQGNVLKDRLAVTVFTGLLSGAQVPVDSPLRSERGAHRLRLLYSPGCRRVGR